MRRSFGCFGGDVALARTARNARWVVPRALELIRRVRNVTGAVVVLIVGAVPRRTAYGAKERREASSFTIRVAAALPVTPENEIDLGRRLHGAAAVKQIAA